MGGCEIQVLCPRLCPGPESPGAVLVPGSHLWTQLHSRVTGCDSSTQERWAQRCRSWGSGDGRRQGNGGGAWLPPGTREGACLPVCRRSRSTNYRDVSEWGSLLSPSIQDLSRKKNVAFCFKDLSLISSCKEEIKSKKRESHNRTSKTKGGQRMSLRRPWDVPPPGVTGPPVALPGVFTAERRPWLDPSLSQNTACPSSPLSCLGPQG